MIIESDILHQFRDVEDDFLLAISSGQDAAQDFACRFSRLNDQLQTFNPEDDPKFDVARAAATNISTIASSLLGVELKAEEFYNELQDDIAGLLSSMTLDNIDTFSPESPTPSTSSLPPSKHRRQSSVQIASEESATHQAAYSWLFTHISNPYPSASTKARLASEIGISPKAMADWFANARRRIGWTALCKRHFANDRCATVDAAQQILLDSNEAGAQYPKEVIDEFQKVKECAERLYDGKVAAQSELATKLGADLPAMCSTAEGAVLSKKKRKSPSPSSVAPRKKATLARQASGVSTASSATLFDLDTYPHPDLSAPSRKRGASSVWEETLTDSDSERQINQRQSRFKRRRESTTSSATMASRQPTLITSASSPSGSSTPAPTTPILPPASLGFTSSPRAQVSSSQTAHLNTLIDDWLASVNSDSLASPADELPLAQGSSRKRRNVEEEEEESEVRRKRAKKERVVSESQASEASTIFDMRSTSEGYATEGLYPTSGVDAFPITFPCADASTEALYALTSALELPPPVQTSAVSLGSDFSNVNAFGDAGLDLGLGLGLFPQSVEEQPLEVGMGSYGFDFSSGVGPDFGVGQLSSPFATTVGPLGSDLAVGTDLASVLQQLHPPTQEQSQLQLDALPEQPELVPLPAQGAEEVASLTGPSGSSEQVTLALSEEELAALAGCLQGSELDLSEDVFGLGFGALDAPVQAQVSAPTCAISPPCASSIAPTIDMDLFERDAKLTRLQSLLAEVNQLQQEVFC